MNSNLLVKLIDLESTEKTWTQVLDKWNDSAFHHLVDLLPSKIIAPWVKAYLISDIKLNEWFNGITAREVARRFGSTEKIVKWVGERMTTGERMMLRENPDMKIIILCCEGEHVLYYSDIIRTITLMYPMMLGPDLQAIRVAIGEGLGPMILRKPQEEESSTPVFMVTTGPQASQVRVFEGDRTCILERVVDGSTTWLFCQKPKSKNFVETPLSLRATWLKWHYTPSRQVDFLNRSYYEMAMPSYAAWSFALHSKQVAQAIMHLPSHALLVVPGDGIGIVAAQWQGQIISGDTVHIQYTHESVRVESFWATMHRGHEADSNLKILVLSYVLTLMNSEEREMALNWPGPVILIDSSDCNVSPKMLHVGPGVFVKGLASAMIPQVTVAEDQTVKESVLYSENLLALKEISYIEENIAVQYWKKMRPLGHCRRYTKQEQSVVVIATVPELIRFWDDSVEVPVYFCPSGRVISRELIVPLIVFMDLKIKTRILYELPLSHSFIPAIKQHSMYAESEVHGKFYFIIPTLVPPIVVKLDGMIMAQTLLYVSHQMEHEVSSFRIRFLGVDQRRVWFNTQEGVIGFVTDNPLKRMMLRHYLDSVDKGSGIQCGFGPSKPEPWAPSDYATDPGRRMVEAKLWAWYTDNWQKLQPDPSLSPLVWEGGGNGPDWESPEDYCYFGRLSGYMSERKS